MTKVKGKILTLLVLSVLAIATFLIGAYAMTGKDNSVVADPVQNEYGVSVKQGASARTTIDSMGIRFFADYSEVALNKNLVTITNGRAKINQGVKMGMIIAPEKALDLTNASVSEILSEYTTVNGQADYYNLLNVAFGMKISSYAVDFTNGNLTVNSDGSITGRAAIVNVKDGNLKHVYKGVGYYYTESTGFVYSELVDGYKIETVINSF